MFKSSFQPKLGHFNDKRQVDKALATSRTLVLFLALFSVRFSLFLSLFLPSTRTMRESTEDSYSKSSEGIAARLKGCIAD